MFLQLFNRPRQHLFHQPADNLDAGQITLVGGPVKGLAGKRLLMQCAVRIAVKKTANLVFQLMDAGDRGGNQLPGNVLVRQPFTANNGIHKMPFNRIFRVQRHIISALHHAGAATFTNQPLDRDGHFLVGRGLLGMQGRKQASAAGTKNQNIGIMSVNYRFHQIISLSEKSSRPQRTPPLPRHRPRSFAGCSTAEFPVP